MQSRPAGAAWISGVRRVVRSVDFAGGEQLYRRESVYREDDQVPCRRNISPSDARAMTVAESTVPFGNASIIVGLGLAIRHGINPRSALIISKVS